MNYREAIDAAIARGDYDYSPIDIDVSGLTVRVTPYGGLTEEQRALYDAMSDSSEDMWCAGWLIGLEFMLWDAINGAPDLVFSGYEDRIAAVANAAKAVNGWCIYEGFVSLDDWMRIYSANRS